MAEPVEVLVKAAVGDPEKIGDCKFRPFLALSHSRFSDNNLFRMTPYPGFRLLHAIRENSN